MKYRVSISVIMPCYNASQYAYEAIVSIIEQSHEDWELIVVDDGSIDNTVQIIQSFNNDRIRLYRLRKNHGNYYARNYGIKQASGKYIAMMDADDISMPHRLRRQFDFLEKHKRVGAISCNYNLIDENGHKKGTVKRNYKYKDLKVRLLLDNYILQSTIFIRSHLLKKHGIKYDERFLYASDYHFVFQCSKYFRILGIEDILLSYRINFDGITISKFEIQQEHARVIRKEIFAYYFGKLLTLSEYDIIQDLSDKYFSKKLYDKLRVERLLNKMLDYNNQSRMLSQQHLYRILISLAIQYFKEELKKQIEDSKIRGYISKLIL